MADAPTVSINLCCYNSEKYLRETLGSIVNQTYKDWELVVINDGSTDSTESIIYEYINQGYPITYRYQENKGLGYSRNEALKRSQGEFIAFIDHDDIWLPEKLEKQIPLFNNSDVGLVFSDTIFFNQKGESQQWYGRRPYWTGRCFRQLLAHYFLAIQTVIIRSDVLEHESAWFDHRFNIIEEADLFRRIAYKWQIDMVELPLSKCRVHSSSLSQIKGHLFAEETLLMLEHYSEIFTDFDNSFAQEINILKKEAMTIKAKWLYKCGDPKNARKLLKIQMNSDHKICLLFLSTYLPVYILRPLINLLHSYRKDITP